ncbi:MAG: hypothetical protein P8Y66_07605 [Nitrospirota bacterium]
MLATAYENVLEASTVSLAAGAENAAFPLYRLWDRNVGRLFRPTQAETVEVTVAQGAEPAPVDRLFIPGGHALEGMDLSVSYSSDGAAYSVLDQWVQPDGSLIVREWPSVTAAFWKFTTTAPAAVPGLAELFLTSTHLWERGPARPSGPLEDVFNVQHAETASGRDRFLIRGEPRRQRVYHVPLAGESQKDQVLALNRAWAGAKPFWLRDHEGAWLFGRLREPLALREVAHRGYAYTFDFEEVLP